MKKKVLIQKWLDHNLNEEEAEAFKQLDAYDSLMKLNEVAQQQKAPHFDSVAHYEKLKQRLPARHKSSLRTFWWSAAALLILAVSVYFTQFYAPLTTFETDLAQRESFLLPDASNVTLLPDSQIRYATSNWDEQRELRLEGDAIFNVAKGKKFTVNTTSGSVSVLGTEFAVNSRSKFFQVTCYEGSVKVMYDTATKILNPGMVFRVIDGNVQFLHLTASEMVVQPHLMHFKSMPLPHVLEAIERNYNISITNIDKVIGNFTGSIDTNDLSNALQSVSIPFQLEFDIEGSKVTLKKN